MQKRIASATIFRLSDNCLWLYFLEVPGRRVLKFVPFFVRGLRGFWNCHRFIDGGVPGLYGIQAHILFLVFGPSVVDVVFRHVLSYR